MNSLLIISVIAALAGLAIGFIIGWRIGPANKAQYRLKKRIADLEEQQAQYHQEVSEHFAETAACLGEVANRYRDLHKHLAQGAQRLANEEVSDALQVTTVNDAPTLTADTLTPPVDYVVDDAPSYKSTEHNNSTQATVETERNVDSQR